MARSEAGKVARRRFAFRVEVQAPPLRLGSRFETVSTGTVTRPANRRLTDVGSGLPNPPPV
jgi:hypothetical protein